MTTPEDAAVSRTVGTRTVDIDIGRQRLSVREQGRVLFEAPVSTSVKGAGEQVGSECTPRGLHVIRAMIGAGCPVNTVFIGRRASGEIYSQRMRDRYPDRDWILTRILWLSGLEPDRNRHGNVDSMRRYIYIHGTPDEEPVGIPGSHGCIRLHNGDILRLFELVGAGTRVEIHE